MSDANKRIACERIDACVRERESQLDLGGLGLTELPRHLFAPEVLAVLSANLRTLNVSSNQLTALPPEIGALGALTELDVSYNRLTTLPPEIGALGALTALDVSGNKLRALPPEIGALGALTALTAWGNKLAALPPEIGALGALTALDVSLNQLTELPPEIGALGALTALRAWSNRLTALPPEIGALGTLTQLGTHGNPLQDPPLRFAERGDAAVRDYLAFKQRHRRGAWVWAGSQLSRNFGLRSRLAAAETVLVTAGLGVAAFAAVPQPVWAAALIAPLLLLKTRASTRLGTRRFGSLMGRLGLKTSSRGVAAWTLPLRVLALGLGSVVIKILTTPYCAMRNPAAALGTMPTNLREQCLEIDLTCVPELVPGLERAYDRRPHESFLFHDLFRQFDARPDHFLHPFRRRNHPTAKTLASAPFLAAFFVVALIYRWYVKGAVVLYLPLLLIDHPSRGTLRRRTAPDPKSPSVWKANALQGAIAGLSLFALLGLRGRDALQTAVGALIDEKIFGVWQALPIAHLVPVGVLSLLLFQATMQLAGRLSEARVRALRTSAGGGRIGRVAQRWLGLAQIFYTLHLIAIVALIVATFLTLAPNAVLIAGGAWTFFAGP